MPIIELLNDGSYDDLKGVEFPQQVIGDIIDNGLLARIPAEELHRIGAGDGFRVSESYAFFMGLEAREVGEAGDAEGEDSTNE